ncbi:MAG: 3'(2'),5'-bisphosphate nucleotidase CysQ [Rhodospirillales bacterium]|nr:3'(2'),5'-bisphosphate nucleotidase CysQ [Rhodospirillales bacterium]
MVRRIALEAGEIVMKYYEEIDGLEVDTKHDDSPVTLADRETENFIQMSLEQLTPGVPMIGEEAIALGKRPKIEKDGYFWIVDPLDGTKEFIKGGEDFTVNIALVKDAVPVLGVVYAPAKGELYAGHGEGTAIRWAEDSDQEKSISVRPPPKGGLVVVASKSHGDARRLEKFLDQFKVEKLVKYGSSLKICVIAAGKADIYPRFGPTCEWDTAAADAVLRAAGGMITDTNGEALKYGGADPKWLNPEFIACSFEWFSAEE